MHLIKVVANISKGKSFHFCSHNMKCKSSKIMTQEKYFIQIKARIHSVLASMLKCYLILKRLSRLSKTKNSITIAHFHPELLSELKRAKIL